MPAFKPIVLIADNSRDHVVDKILPELDRRGYRSDPDGVIEVVHASTQAEAFDLIRRRFFNLALIDLRFDTADRELLGLSVMTELAQHSPSCDAVLMTRFGLENYTEMFRQVAPNPSSRTPVQLINKGDGTSEWYANCVTIACDSYLRPRWSFDGLDAVIEVAQEDERRTRLGLREHPESIAAEVATLASRLFQDLRGVDELDKQATIRFRKMAAGGSSAFVFTAEPRFGRDMAGNEVIGNKLVVKIGKRSKMLDEAERFRSHVQLGVLSDFRTELISVATTDALGALAYSFAGGVSGEIQPLDHYLASGDLEPAERIIRKLFSRESKQWYSIRGPKGSPAKYLHDSYEANLRESIGGVRQAAEEVGRVRTDLQPTSTSYGRSMLHWEGESIPLPQDSDLGNTAIAGEMLTCVVHGDLHGGNVLCAGEKISLIDYGNTGFGPRFLDAAALLCSIRLRSAHGLSARGAIERFVAERELLALDDPFTPTPETPTWARLAMVLEELALTFHGEPTDSTLLRELRRMELIYLLSYFTETDEGPARLALVARIGALLNHLGLP